MRDIKFRAWMNYGNGLKNTLNDSTRLYEVIGNIHENPELVGD